MIDICTSATGCWVLVKCKVKSKELLAWNTAELFSQAESVALHGQRPCRSSFSVTNRNIHQHAICAALQSCRACHDWQNWEQRHPFQTPVWLRVAGRWGVMACHTGSLLYDLGMASDWKKTSPSLVWIRMTVCHMLDNGSLSLGNKQRGVYNEIALQGLWWSQAPGVCTHHLVCRLVLHYTDLNPVTAICASAQSGITRRWEKLSGDNINRALKVNKDTCLQEVNVESRASASAFKLLNHDKM